MACSAATSAPIHRYAIATLLAETAWAITTVALGHLGGRFIPRPPSSMTALSVTRQRYTVARTMLVSRGAGSTPPGQRDAVTDGQHHAVQLIVVGDGPIQAAHRLIGHRGGLFRRRPGVFLAQALQSPPLQSRFLAECVGGFAACQHRRASLCAVGRQPFMSALCDYVKS